MSSSCNSLCCLRHLTMWSAADCSIWNNCSHENAIWSCACAILTLGWSVQWKTERLELKSVPAFGSHFPATQVWKCGRQAAADNRVRHCRYTSSWHHQHQVLCLCHWTLDALTYQHAPENMLYLTHCKGCHHQCLYLWQSNMFKLEV